MAKMRHHHHHRRAQELERVVSDHIQKRGKEKKYKEHHGDKEFNDYQKQHAKRERYDEREWYSSDDQIHHYSEKDRNNKRDAVKRDNDFDVLEKRKRHKGENEQKYHIHKRDKHGTDGDVYSRNVDREKLDHFPHSKRTRNEVHEPNRQIKQEPEDEEDDHHARRRNDRHRIEDRKRKLEEGHKWGKQENERNVSTNVKKEKPNFGLSGKLAEDTNTYNGIVVKYSEPSEARKPKKRWRLYPFKGDQSLPHIALHRQSAFLFGRSRLVADIPTDHPSCSKQQAVLQFRLVDFERADGTLGKRIRPYIIDLDSANGTYVNNNKIEPRRYVELMEKDVIKFGFSTREYVLVHEQSKDEGYTEEEIS
ncbi:putative serine/threonine-protein kinase DDB_G0280133 [Tachypleus tridentatus]|uniref:putative serine/threonine-protein kinase DDB_G0280133 n=1 Tax=Tachypleus tridentatus TaxID=6853 RepID=UPI003FD3634A